MMVRLTRKHAECIDGIDLSSHRVGQILDLPDREAALLIAEGWAKPASAEFTSRAATSDVASAGAPEVSPRTRERSG
jgi:hypothetical protein